MMILDNFWDKERYQARLIDVFKVAETKNLREKYWNKARKDYEQDQSQ